MLDLNKEYEVIIGSFNKFKHVFAIGNKESSRNCRLGSGSNPEGGSDVSPVANIRTSPTDTAVCDSAKNLKKNYICICEFNTLSCNEY